MLFGSSMSGIKEPIATRNNMIAYCVSIMLLVNGMAVIAIEFTICVFPSIKFIALLLLYFCY